MKKECINQEQCDTRYVLRVWFFRTIILSFITVVPGSYAIIWKISSFKYQLENNFTELKKDTDRRLIYMEGKIKEMEDLNKNIDTLKNWLRPR